MKVIFSKSAARILNKLDRRIQKRIINKPHFYLKQENPLHFAEPLEDRRLGEYRFRIGDYRALLDIENQKIIILKVGHRKEIYKDC